MRVQLKLREDSSDRQRKDFLRRLESEVDSLEPLFPNESDEELASLYTLDLDDDASAEALDKLQKEPEVEFAEPEPERQLYLPKEARSASAPRRSSKRASR
jgi:hypothetical protein